MPEAGLVIRLYLDADVDVKLAANLRVALSSLRKHLEPYVLITRDTVVMNPEAEVWLDTAELEGKLAEAQDPAVRITAERAGREEILAHVLPCRLPHPSRLLRVLKEIERLLEFASVQTKSSPYAIALTVTRSVGADQRGGHAPPLCCLGNLFGLTTVSPSHI